MVVGAAEDEEGKKGLHWMVLYSTHRRGASGGRGVQEGVEGALKGDEKRSYSPLIPVRGRVHLVS